MCRPNFSNCQKQKQNPNQAQNSNQSQNSNQIQLQSKRGTLELVQTIDNRVRSFSSQPKFKAVSLNHLFEVAKAFHMSKKIN